MFSLPILSKLKSESRFNNGLHLRFRLKNVHIFGKICVVGFFKVH